MSSAVRDRAAADTAVDPLGPASTAPAAATWREALRIPVLAWAVSRIIVVGTVLIGTAWLGHHGPAGDPSVYHALLPLGSWDAGWYFDIARHGYAHDSGTITTIQTNLAFFPMLPLILRVGLALGLNGFAWGLAVTNLAFMGALVAVHAITRVRFGQAMADRAAWCLALAPPAVYASMVYTDGITLALAAAAGYAALRQRWLLAGLAGAGAALMRPPGLIVALLVALIAVMEADVTWGTRLRHAALGAVPGLLAVATFFAWMQAARGSWRLPMVAERAWRRPPLNVHIFSAIWSSSYDIVARPIQRRWPDFLHWMTWSADARDLIFAILLLALVAWLWRSEGTWRSPWAAYATVAVLFPFGGGGVGSMTRYSLIAFPLIWPVAAWAGRGGRVRGPALAAVAVVVMIALSLQLQYAAP
jgi:hypothetical protein